MEITAREQRHPRVSLEDAAGTHIHSAGYWHSTRLTRGRHERPVRGLDEDRAGVADAAESAVAGRPRAASGQEQL
ncbi:uncharacterized protein KRP23_10195 [Phytophthora ramorum]|uniref:uncharacterized protein n=1 Tax=Phytophthora ramorum TaxID=164328 RepID=UPI0030B2C24B|nr:hypothetical protein KRP23_10195 [Phytophthora ramorum]KAH7503818.1 hypothetical protein KRP22_6866 [Phytophthora ramorum]